MNIKYNFFFRLFMLAILLLIASNSYTQSSLLLSTLDNANQLRDKGNFQKAANVLDEFNTKYPGNNWIMRLYAETLYWMKDYDKAEIIYKEAINIHPDNLDIKYEYAILLFDIGKYNKAKDLIYEYIKENPNVAGAETLLGISLYYLGDYINAGKHLEKSLALNPENKRAETFLQTLSYITDPWINISSSYYEDSQIIKQLSPSLGGGMYFSNLLQPSFNFDFQNFSYYDTSSIYFDFQAHNKFDIKNLNLKVKISAGAFYADENPDLSWGISLQKKLWKHFKLIANAERSAYTNTIASIADPFLRNKYNFSLEWQKTNSWFAKTGYIAEYFPDENIVNSFYAWVLSPAINFSIFEMYFGYAFNYANSLESRFVPENSLSEILEDYQENEKITGVYSPYFTPNTQYGNSFLTNINIPASKDIKIKLHASVGFYATAMNPNFYLDNNNNNKTIIKQDFYRENFTPLDLGIDLNTKLTSKMIFNINYSYLKTFYFHSNNLNLGLKIIL